MTDPASATWQERSLSYLRDIEQAFRMGILPSPEAFRRMLGLDLRLRIRVDYTPSIQETFPDLLDFFQIEGLRGGEVDEDPSGFFWATPQLTGNTSGLHMVDMVPLDPDKSVSIQDLEASFSSGERYATLGEALHFLKHNTGSGRMFPLVVVHQLPSGERMGVFIGSLSGGASRVIRFRSLDLQWRRGCRHLIVTS